MKSLLVIFIFLCTHTYPQGKTLADIMPLKEGKVLYEKLVVVDSASKSSLYQRGKLWGLSNFKSQKDAIQIDDKDDGILAYKTFSLYPYQITIDKFPFSGKYKIEYLIKIYVKDDRAKILIADIVLSSSVSGSEGATMSIEEVANSYEHPNDSLINSFKMKKKDKEIAKDAYEKQKEIFISTLESANLNFLTTIKSIEDYLTGRIKSDMDF